MRRSPVVGWWLVVVSPLVVAAFVLLWRPWAPGLDMAMTEFRVRDVGGRHTPLIGLPGRIGNFPDQGSHPGPWSFYLIAPIYRLTGARAWGLELASAALNAAAIGLALYIAHRRHPRWGALVIALVAAIAIRGFGLSVLTHPWNPYFPLLFWLLALVAAWAVVAGDHHHLVTVVVAASIAAQTHVPYLLLGIALSIVALVPVAVAARRAEPGTRRSLGIALGVGAVVWLPPFADQIRREPGNIRMLVEHFTGEPDEPRIALGTAMRVFFRHLDVVAVLPDLVTEPDAFVHRSGLSGGPGLGGMVVFAAWVAAAIWSWRHGSRSQRALHTVLAVVLVVQFVSISRIFGKVWYYLTLWAWLHLLLVLVAVAWTACTAAATRDRSVTVDRVRTPVAVATVALTVVSITMAFVLRPPDHQLSDGLRAVVPDVVESLDDGVGPAPGPDARFVVFWQDAWFIGTQGYGLVNELERRGYTVGVHDTWRVPVTHQRVIRDFDAEVHLVTGMFIDQWRERAGFVEVAYVDVRSDAERARFGELRDRVIDDLQILGRDDLIPVVDENLFGASLDPDLPRDVVDDLSEMIEIGLPVAVFIAPTGSSF